MDTSVCPAAPFLQDSARYRYSARIDPLRYRQAAWLVGTSTALGLLYPVFGDGFSSIVPYINGFVIGLFGGLSVAAIELFLLQAVRKKMTFILLVLVKSALYSAIITFHVFIVILISRSVQFGHTPGETLASETFRHFLFHEDFIIIVVYALVLVSLIIFFREMSRKLGQGVLLNLVTGRYFRPRRENRVFMFLDLNSSATHAESLGDLAYHNLLNDFFHDITTPIMRSKGKIHHYVGDEVVVSWPNRKGVTTDICFSAYLNCCLKIRSLDNRYLSTYGIAPAFKAAFHCGEVICGEIGEVKSEIVFHGDVMNTTARLERLCSDQNERVLISSAFHGHLSPSLQNNFESAGELKLRGKDKAIQVYRLAGSS